jgi:hypothetical protein
VRVGEQPSAHVVGPYWFFTQMEQFSPAQPL